MADNPATTAGFVVAGVATAAVCSSLGGLSTGSSGAIGAVVVASCLAATNFLKVDVKEPTVKKSKAEKKRDKRAAQAAKAAARAERQQQFTKDVPDVEEEEEVEKPKVQSKSSLRRAKKQEAKKKAEAEAAAVAKAEKAAKKKAKKKAKKAAPEPEPEPEPTKKKKKKKKKKAVVVVESEEDEPLEVTDPADDGWVVQTKSLSSKEKKAKQAKVAAAVVPSANGESKQVEHTQEVTISSKYYGLIIGPGGATRQAISDATGCDIQVPKRDESGPIVVKGNRQACEVCVKALEELVEKGWSSLLDKDTTDEGVVVPARLHGVIIGPRGATIQAIQTKTGTRVNMPDKDSASERVTVVGPQPGVIAAIEAINQLVADGFSTLTHENFVKDSVSVPGNQIATLIGTGGSTIKELQKRTGAKINIPNGARGAVINVTLVGEVGQVAAARVAILGLLKPPEPIPISAEWTQQATLQMLNLW